MNQQVIEKLAIEPKRHKSLVGNVSTTYTVSVVAATFAEFVTYPLDLTKTRLQIQGERGGTHGKYRGMWATAGGIIREEGFFKLWCGMTPAIYRHMVYSGVRIVTFEFLRDSVITRDPDGSVFGTWHAFTEIVKKGGVRGLWKGSVPNVQRAALVNLGDLTTYDTAKRFILTHTNLPDTYITHTLSSGCAGLVAATMGTPADVIKTRIMNQPTDAKGNGLLYKGSIDCLLKTVENEGMFALYKGFFPVWIRMAPWSLTFWLSFEKIRSTLAASGF